MQAEQEIIQGHHSKIIL